MSINQVNRENWNKQKRLLGVSYGNYALFRADCSRLPNCSWRGPKQASPKCATLVCGWLWTEVNQSPRYSVRAITSPSTASKNLDRGPGSRRELSPEKTMKNMYGLGLVSWGEAQQGLGIKFFSASHCLSVAFKPQLPDCLSVWVSWGSHTYVIKFVFLC